jgi:hypothetical protein
MDGNLIPSSWFIARSKEVIDVAEFYHDFFLVEDQVTMSMLESQVKLVREFKEDEEVE